MIGPVSSISSSASSADSYEPGKFRERKRCLDLRSKILLTEEGSRFYLDRKLGLHEFNVEDGKTHFGFKVKSLDIPWLRRLLLANFVERAEFPVRDLGSVKNEIGDIARLVVFSLLYGDFRSSVYVRTLDSEIIRRWNRLHPHNAVDTKKSLFPGELRNTLSSKGDAIKAIKKEIFLPIYRTISVDARKTPEDHRRLYHFVNELLNYLDPLTYFILLGSPVEERQILEKFISEKIYSAIERVDLADYLALMVLELMGAAERSTLIELLGNDVRPSEIRLRLENPETRRTLLSSLPTGLSSAMVWNLSRRWSPLGHWRYRLRLSLYDGSSDFEDTKRLFEERGRLSVEDRNLQEFYEQGTGPYGDDGLGWYYLSFIGEACQEMGVSFVATVREQPGKGTAAVHLTLQL